MILPVRDAVLLKCPNRRGVVWFRKIILVAKGELSQRFETRDKFKAHYKMFGMGIVV